MKVDPKRNDKSNITLAIDKHLLAEVKRLSKSKNASINATIAEIIMKHVLFYDMASKMEYIVISPLIHSELLEAVDEKRLTKTVHQAFDTMLMSIFTHNDIDLTLNNSIKYFFEGIALWSGLYTIFKHHTDKEGCMCLVFEHKYGIKWSRILASLFLCLIEDILHLRADQKVLANTLVIRILDR